MNTFLLQKYFECFCDVNLTLASPIWNLVLRTSVKATDVEIPLSYGMQHLYTRSKSAALLNDPVTEQ